MIPEEIAILKEIASGQKISVQYFPGGKIYTIPMAAFLLDLTHDPFTEEDDDMPVYVDCEYTMQMGTMFVKCEILDKNGKVLMPTTFIPLDKKKQNATHRELMSLINLCSKRIIAQEMSRNKYAIASAIQSATLGQEYS